VRNYYFLLRFIFFLILLKIYWLLAFIQCNKCNWWWSTKSCSKHIAGNGFFVHFNIYDIDCSRWRKNEYGLLILYYFTQFLYNFIFLYFIVSNSSGVLYRWNRRWFGLWFSYSAIWCYDLRNHSRFVLT